MSVKNPPTPLSSSEWGDYAKAKNIAGHKDKPLTNDPMETTWVGIHMWKQAVEKPRHGHRQVEIAAANWPRTLCAHDRLPARWMKKSPTKP